LPVQDTTLIRRLAALEALRPDPRDVQQYAQWKLDIEAVRQEIRRQAVDVLRQARLAALTTTRAVFTIDDIASLAPYDLLVFDEASQVGMAHALALAPLGRHVTFAGDPNQLAPIVQSEDEGAKQWLGRSPFVLMNPRARSTCRLNEQSRMAEEINKVVGGVFYDGDLRVAPDSLKDHDWLNYRRLVSVEPLDTRTASVIPVTEEGVWSQKYGGPIRPASADLICDLVSNLTMTLSAEDVLVLTPFRAQRTFIKMRLRHTGQTRVTVSTVHRAQGSERHTVLFDPVSGGSPFLQTDDARRLVNVALSRAQARLVVFLSPQDRGNRLLEQIGFLLSPSVAKPGRAHSAPAPSICEFTTNEHFPHCLINQRIQIGPVVGIVRETPDWGSKIVLVDDESGRDRTYKTGFVVQMCGGSKDVPLRPPPPRNEPPRRSTTVPLTPRLIKKRPGD
jgi:hypothetical protein